jgi:ornithine cyclodeaminase
VRPLRDVRVWSRNAERCAVLARAAEEELGIEARVGTSARDAVGGADIVCTVTSASAPVVESSWIMPGTHINAVGTHRPTERELDSDTVARARVFVDHLPAALAEAGDLLVPIAEGLIGRAHILGDLSGLLSGRIVGRAMDPDVTVFKSVGVAVTDVAAATYVYERAVATGRGNAVRLT